MILISKAMRGLAVASLATLSIVACGEAPTSLPANTEITEGALPNWEVTDTTYSSGHLQTDSTLWFRRVWVCKVGTSANFAVSVNGGAPTLVSLVNDECRQVHYYAPGWQGNPDNPAFFGADTVTVTELLTDMSITLDSIQVDSTHNFTKIRLGTFTGINSVTAIVTRSKGSILTFFNSTYEEPPTGGQGCTPGYWKQSQHFDSWNGYAPNQLFSSVFENAFPGMTLLQVLQQGGGGLNALGRHTVAALLNSAQDGVSYNIGSPAGVIAMFNDAFPGSDYEGLKNLFAGYNEQGCPIS